MPTAERALQIARPTDASQAGQGVFAFDSGPLPSAGSYTVVAEWSEHRLGVPLTSARSPATSITIAPGPPTDARVWSTRISLCLRNFPRLCCWLACGLVLTTASVLLHTAAGMTTAQADGSAPARPSCWIGVVACYQLVGSRPRRCLSRRRFRLQVSLSNESLATLAVGNGPALSDRIALKQLVVQLLDDHGNAAHHPGAEVRVCRCRLFVPLRRSPCLACQQAPLLAAIHRFRGMSI